MSLEEAEDPTWCEKIARNANVNLQIIRYAFLHKTAFVL